MYWGVKILFLEKYINIEALGVNSNKIYDGLYNKLSNIVDVNDIDVNDLIYYEKLSNIIFIGNR